MILIPRVPIKSDYFAFQGGLDLVSPALYKKPGTLVGVLNYEPTIDGGYARAPGYESFDGRQSPSDAEATAFSCALSTIPAAGETITIGGVTCTFVSVVQDGALVANASGVIPPATQMLVGGVSVGATAPVTSMPYAVTPSMEAQWKVDVASHYRTLVQAVPGSGPVRGVWLYNGDVYSWRDNAGGTACVMFKASASGWAAVSMDEEVSFSNANSSVQEGDTLTKGAVTATIVRVLVQSGSLASGVNTGRLIIRSRAGGALSAGAATSTGSGALTLSGAQSAITLPPGGTYRLRNHNFYGQAGTVRMYGANGVGRSFEFDGTTFVPISTGAVPDAPSHIETNRGRLFLGQRSSLQYSAAGIPHSFDGVLFAGEVAVGDDITALQTMAGRSIGVFTRNSTYAFNGSTSDDFALENIAPKSGAINGVVTMLTQTYALDALGLVAVKPVQEYGNFGAEPVSRHIQPLIDSARDTAVCAVSMVNKDQLRIFCSDGSVIVMHPRPGTTAEFTRLLFLFSPTCACSERDSSGNERTFVGAQDGFVYEIGKGSTYNGSSIESHLSLAYFHAKSPRERKHFRFSVLEAVSSLYTSVRFIADFSHGDPQSMPVVQDGLQVIGSGGKWDLANWDEFFWDSPEVVSTKVRTEGSGTNMSMTFYGDTTLDFGHTLQGVTVHYTPSRLQR